MKNPIDNKTNRSIGHPATIPQLTCIVLYALLVLVALIAVPPSVLGQTVNTVTGPQAATRGPADTLRGPFGLRALFPMTRSIQLLLAVSPLSREPDLTGIPIRPGRYSLSRMVLATTR